MQLRSGVDRLAIWPIRSQRHDVDVVLPPGRVRTFCDLPGETLLSGAAIRLHSGKTSGTEGQTCSPNILDMGDEVRIPKGIKILGTPVGSVAFLEEISNKRLKDERRLWDAIPCVPNLQCTFRSCCNAPGHDVTTFCAYYRPVSQCSALMGTMLAWSAS